MSDEKLTPAEAAKALRCCAWSMPRCVECPARDLIRCHSTVKNRAAELLEEATGDRREKPWS